MKTCGVCNNRLGMLRFKYTGGCVCRTCYEAASNHCTETIREMCLEEIQQRISLYAEASKELTGFEVTNRIGNYLLIDDKNKRFCILHNRLGSKEYSHPEQFPIGDVKYCKVNCNLDLTQNGADGDNFNERSVITRLGIDIFFHSSSKVQHISILSTPVRRKSFAFKRSSAFMQAIVEYFETNGVICKNMDSRA